jgi:Rad3-related DNA helicase
VFEAGEEVSQKDYIQAALDDMIYFVHRHVERIEEYRRFADDVQMKLREKMRSSPDLKPFLDSMEEIVQQIPQECEVQKENMKTDAFADQLAKKTIALASKKDPGNLKAFMELLKAWRDMGGAQDYVVAKCHTITRNLCQTAGYGCGGFPQAVSFAEEIRAACRQTLRNPDGYEIWADY